MHSGRRARGRGDRRCTPTWRQGCGPSSASTRRSRCSWNRRTPKRAGRLSAWRLTTTYRSPWPSGTASLLIQTTLANAPSSEPERRHGHRAPEAGHIGRHAASYCRQGPFSWKSPQHDVPVQRPIQLDDQHVASPLGLDPGTRDLGLQLLQQVRVVRWQIVFSGHQASPLPTRICATGCGTYAMGYRSCPAG